MHAHFGTNSAAVAMLCRTLGGPPFSFTIHGPEEFDKPHLLHLTEKIERARAVFAVSNFGRSQVYRHCGHAHWPKVHVVHCGVDASFLAAPPSPPPAEPRLVSVGRLSEQKGQLLLIEALGELHRRGRDFHLTLVGDGELRGEVERAIDRHDLRAKVTLAGWADEAAVRAHMLAAAGPGAAQLRRGVARGHHGGPGPGPSGADHVCRRDSRAGRVRQERLAGAGRVGRAIWSPPWRRCWRQRRRSWPRWARRGA